MRRTAWYGGRRGRNAFSRQTARYGDKPVSRIQIIDAQGRLAAESDTCLLPPYHAVVNVFLPHRNLLSLQAIYYWKAVILIWSNNESIQESTASSYVYYKIQGKLWRPEVGKNKTQRAQDHHARTTTSDPRAQQPQIARTILIPHRPRAQIASTISLHKNCLTLVI